MGREDWQLLREQNAALPRLENLAQRVDELLYALSRQAAELSTSELLPLEPIVGRQQPSLAEQGRSGAASS